MRITDLEVEGYGVWSGLRIEKFSDSLNVLYGPNEAGKTTLLQFVRSMLYGFSPGRRRYLPPVHGGRPGGVLQLAHRPQKVAADRLLLVPLRRKRLGKLDFQRYGPGGRRSVAVLAAEPIAQLGGQVPAPQLRNHRTLAGNRPRDQQGRCCIGPLSLWERARVRASVLEITGPHPLPLSQRERGVADALSERERGESWHGLQ